MADSGPKINSGTEWPIPAEVFKLYSTPNGKPTDAYWGPETVNKKPKGRVFYDVDVPELLYYPCENSKTAVVVAPGGGYVSLALDHEGTEVAQWLNSIGITAFVLKYRVLGQGCRFEKFGKYAIDDGKQALKFIRGKMERLGLEKLGMIGFSAGGHLAISIAEMQEPEYRLDFMMLIYPWDKIAALFQFGCISLGNQFLQVKPVETTPPIFMAVAKGDASSKVETLSWYWQKLEELDIKPRRFKIYEEGEHGIGLGTHLGRRDTDHLKDWPNAATDFLQELSAKDIIPDFGTKETKRGGDVTQISEIPSPQTEVQASDLGGAPLVDPDVKIDSEKDAKDAKTSEERPEEWEKHSFSIGDEILLVNLYEDTELNDTEGVVVEGENAEGKVLIKSYKTGEIFRVKVKNLCHVGDKLSEQNFEYKRITYKAGDEILLMHLSSETELNGTEGVVVQDENPEGTCLVKIRTTDEVILVGRENVYPIENS